MNAAAWKDINEDFMRPITKAPMFLLQQLVNCKLQDEPINRGEIEEETMKKRREKKGKG